MVAARGAGVGGVARRRDASDVLAGNSDSNGRNVLSMSGPFDSAIAEAAAAAEAGSLAVAPELPKLPPIPHEICMMVFGNDSDTDNHSRDRGAVRSVAMKSAEKEKLSLLMKNLHAWYLK